MPPSDKRLQLTPNSLLQTAVMAFERRASLPRHSRSVLLGAAEPHIRYTARNGGRTDVQSGTLLVIDAAINVLLGLLLIAFPSNLVAALGIPQAEVAFYPSFLGAVLF
jgi:hypothetical protein